MTNQRRSFSSRLARIALAAAVVAAAVLTPVTAALAPTAPASAATAANPQPVWASSAWRNHSTGTTAPLKLRVSLARAYSAGAKKHDNVSAAQFAAAFKKAAAFVGKATGGRVTASLTQNKAAWGKVKGLCGLTNVGNTSKIQDELGLSKGSLRDTATSTWIGITYTSGCSGASGLCPWGLETDSATADALAESLVEYLQVYIVGHNLGDFPSFATTVINCSSSGVRVPLSARLLSDCPAGKNEGYSFAAAGQINVAKNTGIPATEKLSWGVLTAAQVKRVSSGTHQFALVANESSSKGVKLIELGGPGKAPHLFLEADIVNGRLQLVTSIDQQASSAKKWRLSTRSLVLIGDLVTNPASTDLATSPDNASRAFDIPNGTSWVSPAKFDKLKSMPAFRITVTSRTKTTIKLTIRTGR